MKNKKKKGSSLLMVIMIFAILSTLGISMLSMTSSDYYRRVGETKKLQNLYGAESGLDLSYNILAKVFESAVVYGNEGVKELINSADGRVSVVEQEIQNVKNGAAVKFPVSQDKPNESTLITVDGKINEVGYKELKDKTFKVNFNKFIDLSTEYCIDSGKTIDVNGYFIIPDSYSLATDEEANEKKKFLDGLNGTLITMPEESVIDENTSIKSVVQAKTRDVARDSVDVVANEEFTVGIVSEFTPDGDEIRQISSKYTMKVPEYQEYIETNEVKMKIHPMLNKTIVVDGNMNVEGDMKVTGDVHVKGNPASIDYSGDYGTAYNKYKGGIKVDKAISGANLNVTGDITTPSSLLIKKNSKVNVAGNICAGNIALGKTSPADDQISKSSLININNPSSNYGIYLSNDLSINGDEVSVNIDNFYGINDIGTEPKDNTISEANKAINSSSIIVNSNNFTELKINKEAYILGTAYINTQDKYQTGESVAVKGNYIAYTDSLGKDVEFKYDKPLQLISKIDGKDATVFDKANHIDEYADFTGNKENLNLVKIILPTETYATGAYITNSNIVNGKKNFVVDNAGKIKNMKSIFANNVFYMGGAKEINKTENELIDKFPTVPEDAKTVATEIDFTKLSNKDEVTVEGYRVIFNNGKTPITIKGTTGENEKTKLSGVIITNGDVIIEGNVEFTGLIIAEGDLNCKDGNIEVKRDLTLVRQIIAKYYDNDLKDVIKEYDGLSTETIRVSVSEVNDEELTFSVKNYISKGVWKVENAAENPIKDK